MSRLCRLLLVAVIALGVTAPSAAAVPDKKLGDYLGTMWKTVLETPASQNPFTGGPGLCVDLGGVVAPFGGPGLDVTCTVKPGTKVFAASWSAECSTLEDPPFQGVDEPSLRDCVHTVNAGITTTEVFLDGTLVPVIKVTSGLLHLDLPNGNIFGKPAGTGTPPYLSVADGWVVLLHPLTPGTHTIRLHIAGQFPQVSLPIDSTTTIIVKPGH